MADKIYNKIIPFLILIQPIFDAITSIMVSLNSNVTLGIIVKIIIMILCIIYLIFLDKKNRKFNILFIIFLIIFSSVNIYINLETIKVQFLVYFNYMVKFIYLLIMLLYFIRWFKTGNKIKLYQLRTPIILISLIFLFSILTNTFFYSYDSTRRGISGWFGSTNEIGALLCLFFPISLFNAFHNPEGKKIDYILFIINGIILLMLGTKVGLLGYYITLVCYIIYKFIIIKRKKMDYKFLVIITIFILPLMFFKELPAIYNTNLKVKNNHIEETINESTNTNEEIDSILLSGRDLFEEEIKENREKNVLPFLFGKSHLTSSNFILICERDFLDIYYMYGLIGVLILLSLLIYILIEPIKYFFKDIKNRVYNIRAISCVLAVILVLAISYISGHVLLSPSVSTYFALILAILCDKCNKDEKNVNNKMIIYMPKLSVGGMEQALINLLNMSDLTKKYKIDLYLGYCIEKKYLNSVPKEVNVILLCRGNWNAASKFFTGIKMLCSYINLLVNPYKYDVSICYAYQHGILSKLSRLSSKNNIIFVHNDLLKCRTPEKLKKLKRSVKFEMFSKVVCVSEGAKKSFEKVYPNYKGKIVTINNYINGEKILTLSNEKIKDLRKNKKITFINIGRHEEKAKKLTRIIEASKKLLDKKYEFRVILVGDGQDHSLYKNMIKDYKLEKNILLLGKKVNPYPYLKLSDCFILSSEYEGYGIVLDESRILNVPIISTDVADSKKIMNDGYGILCKNTTDGIYVAMKQFLDKGYKIKKEFDYHKFNDNVTKKINKIVVGDKDEKGNVYF